MGVTEEELIRNKMNKTTLFIFIAGLLFISNTLQSKVIWQIGENDHSASEFALSDNGYANYIANDFGWEDKYFLVGHSDEKTDWPYIIPGTSDTWGGTWGTSGWRSSTLNILFGIDELPTNGAWKLTVDILDYNVEDRPLFKVLVNGRAWKYSCHY